MTSAPKSRNRFAEPLKFLPVLFLIGIIAILWSIYVAYHLMPLLDEPRTARRGLVQFVVFNVVAVFLCISYARCIITHPGSIPEDDLRWANIAPELRSRDPEGTPQESKRSGDRRSCKWCTKYKPDRCHHCRVCQACILKMDHHCPWIYSCVGFGNHKYFFLFVMYSCFETHLILWTMHESLRSAMQPEKPFLQMFFLLFGETLAGLMCFLVSVFFAFHIWLMQKGMTTIEFCEKSLKKSSSHENPYNRGAYGNTCAALGDNPLLWFFPCSPPSGDGLCWVSEDTPLELCKGRETGGNHKMYQDEKA